MKQVMKEGSWAGKKRGGVFSILGSYRGAVVVLVVLAVASNGINLVIPKIVSRAIDTYLTGHFDARVVTLEFVFAGFFIFVFSYVQAIMQTRVSEKVARDLRGRLSDKLSNCDFSYVTGVGSSRLLTNVTSDIDAIKLFVSMAVVVIASSVLMIVGTCVMLLLINWKLALAIIAIIPVIGGAFMYVLRKVRVLFKQSREVIDRLNKIINESILGAALVRVLNSQVIEFHKFETSNATARDLSMSILRLFASLIPIVVFVANLGMLSILVLGGHYVITGAMSLGDLSAFVNYLSLLIFPIIMIGFMSNIIASATASFNRINQLLEQPFDEPEGFVERIEAGTIELRDVSLELSGKPVLKNLSARVEAGARVAIIGPTAAGKTQLINLLSNLLQPTSGEILYDSIPLKDYVKDRFGTQVGIVFQDSVIFNMSIGQNIAFGSNVSKGDLQRAIAVAELEDLLARLPQGLDTPISERGMSLSGGQKQRIMLARALALRPRVLLLDDFTARVDPATEIKILDNLREYCPGITLVSVTQKVSTASHYDHIIVMMEGEILARGTHEQLLASCAEYVQICNSQRSTNHIV